MFSMCSELAPRAHIPDTRIPQLMQPCIYNNHKKSQLSQKNIQLTLLAVNWNDAKVSSCSRSTRVAVYRVPSLSCGTSVLRYFFHLSIFVPGSFALCLKPITCLSLSLGNWDANHLLSSEENWQNGQNWQNGPNGQNG